MNERESINLWLPPQYLLRKTRALSFIKGWKDVKSFIEIGCGRGDFACTLAELGLKGTGIDLSEEAIREAEKLRDLRGLQPPSLSFKICILSIPFEKLDLSTGYLLLGEKVEKESL